MAPPTEVSRKKIALFFLALTLFFGIIFLFTFLALDAFTIPYLSPLAHFLFRIISPFVPLVFPFYLSIFLKVCSYPKASWPGKKRWVLITAAWGVTHLERVVRNTWAIWGDAMIGKGAEGICGLEECRGKWVEEVLVVLVVVAHAKGWRWDGGVGDKWVESVVEQEKKKLEVVRGSDEVQVMEKGEVTVADSGSEDEKRVLMVREGVVESGEEKEDLLIEAETEEEIIVERIEDVKV